MSFCIQRNRIGVISCHVTTHAHQAASQLTTCTRWVAVLSGYPSSAGSQAAIKPIKSLRGTQPWEVRRVWRSREGARRATMSCGWVFRARSLLLAASIPVRGAPFFTPSAEHSDDRPGMTSAALFRETPKSCEREKTRKPRCTWSWRYSLVASRRFLHLLQPC